MGALGNRMNNRRKLIVSLGAGALVAPFGSFGQQPAKLPRIGYLVIADSPELNNAFRQGLHELGYVEKQTILVESRNAGGSEERLPALAAELLRLNVEIIVAPDPPSFRAAMNVTKVVPIVMRASRDPVAEGVAASLAHPGGNVTGVFSLYSELNEKRLELLKEAVPAVSRVMVLFDPNYASMKRLQSTENAAHKLGLNLVPMEVRSTGDFESAFKRASRQRVNGVLVVRAPLMIANAAQIARLAAKFRLPAVYDEGRYTNAGGLMSYGAHLQDLYRRTATYVDKILKGAKPGDLPIEQPTRFELIVNIKTAQALGIEIPNSILVQATKVIE